MLAKRALSTLIPPKIVSAKNLGSAPNAQRISQVVQFYKSLPQGAAPAYKPSGPIGKYKAKYFDGENASGKPLLHLALFVLGMGYSMEYYFHLRHHKDGAEH
ncbi:LADA_0B03730g1_1 [Lachancea dasiensis]|uniref:LADA_0B03730g1_1 n=1 Tax=Lachancea dasiensis TaxID=1072105 RepID=A0A1G4ISS0_9SACH|nr:LADA_0B03730g1_1 [Lachancea dasiensis]